VIEVPAWRAALTPSPPRTFRKRSGSSGNRHSWCVSDSPSSGFRALGDTWAPGDTPVRAFGRGFDSPSQVASSLPEPVASLHGGGTSRIERGAEAGPQHRPSAPTFQAAIEQAVAAKSIPLGTASSGRCYYWCYLRIEKDRSGSKRAETVVVRKHRRDAGLRAKHPLSLGLIILSGRPYKARATGSIPVPPILVILVRCFGILSASRDCPARFLGAGAYSWCHFTDAVESLDGLVEAAPALAAPGVGKFAHR
jgi:hypothetical protein